MARWIGRPRMRHVLSRRFCRERIVRSGFNGGVRVGRGLTTSTVTGAPNLFLVQLGGLACLEFPDEEAIFRGLLPA
jgi:hypothetical protein